MTLEQLLKTIAEAQSKSKMNCPLRIYPSCHPLSSIDVFVDGKKKMITLSCAKCDRILCLIKPIPPGA